jgi:hypothetical protein
MPNTGWIHRASVSALALVLLAGAGCASKQEKAIEQAKKQAITTGQPQQVVSVDKDGLTTTTVVQPPASGQKEPTLVTTTAPPAAGAPAPKPSEPTVSALQQPPAQEQQAPQGPPPPLEVSIPAGTGLAVRVDQRISVKTSHAGDTFTGEIVEPITASDGSLLVPKLSRVKGLVAAAHKRGHFKGASFLELRLTSLTLNGTEYPLKTRDLTQTKKGKGKRSTAMIAGGSGLGMVIGGVASGGVGLLIGGLAGGGAGTAAAGLTGNRDIDIPAESIVHFKLADDLVVQESH